jgi:hypothetical protein
MRRITLTKIEASHAAWAFGAMSDYWGAPCAPDQTPDAQAEGVVENDLVVPPGATMPWLDGTTLVLSSWDEVNNDLVFRVGEQLFDMLHPDDLVWDDFGDMSPQKQAAHRRACTTFVDKVEG